MDVDVEGVNAPVAELTSFVAAIGNYPAIANLLDDETRTLTVFAPTNDAFAAFDGPLDAEELERVLVYHVLSGTNLDSTAIAALTPGSATTFVTASGADLSVMLNDMGTVEVIDGTGNAVPVLARVEDPVNGTVHTIGNLLFPATVDSDPGDRPSDVEETPFGAIQSDDSLSSFEALVIASGIEQSLADPANSTFLTFAPTDATIDPSVTTAAAYIVASLGSRITEAPAPGTYVGSGPQALTFVVTGEGEALTVNGLPAAFVVGGDGGALVKYGF